MCDTFRRRQCAPSLPSAHDAAHHTPCSVVCARFACAVDQASTDRTNATLGCVLTPFCEHGRGGRRRRSPTRLATVEKELWTLQACLMLRHPIDSVSPHPQEGANSARASLPPSGCLGELNMKADVGGTCWIHSVPLQAHHGHERLRWSVEFGEAKGPARPRAARLSCWFQTKRLEAQKRTELENDGQRKRGRHTRTWGRCISAAQVR